MSYSSQSPSEPRRENRKSCLDAGGLSLRRQSEKVKLITVAARYGFNHRVFICYTPSNSIMQLGGIKNPCTQKSKNKKAATPSASEL